MTIDIETKKLKFLTFDFHFFVTYFIKSKYNLSNIDSRNQFKQMLQSNARDYQCKQCVTRMTILKSSRENVKTFSFFISIST